MYYVSLLLAAVLLTYTLSCALLDRWVQASTGFLLTLIVCGVALRLDRSIPDHNIELGPTFIGAALVKFSISIGAFLISAMIRRRNS